MRASRPGQSVLLLLDVIDILRQEAVDYLVIGAFALSVHGVLRASSDADALLQVSSAKLRRLRSVFEEAGYHVELRRGNPDDPIPAMMVVSDSHDNRVDLLAGIRGLDPKAFSRGIEVTHLGATMRFVGRADFIAMKCYAGGPQDLLDARAAYRAADDALDVDLMRRIARRFGRDAADQLEKIIA